MKKLHVEPGGFLNGRLEVPGDKSISHRVLLLASLADGTSVIRGLSDGDDVNRTLLIIESLGAEVEFSTSGELKIKGGSLEEPENVLNVGNSGTAIRLLAGLLVGLPFAATLDGDHSVRSRPMDRVVQPLREMGADIEASGLLDSRAPLNIRGGGLKGIEYHLPVASAQVKGAVLFAGLSAEGPTTVFETIATRTHTEEIMSTLGINVEITPESVTVHPGRPQPFEYQVPGDPSQAAFWAVAASIVPGSELTIEQVYRGQARTGFVEVLRRMGADINHDKKTGNLNVASAPLFGTTVESYEVPGLVDEIPVLAVAAACATGKTRFREVSELRIKESNRLETICSELGAMGVYLETIGDDLLVNGGQLRGTEVNTFGDHRIGMACAIAALVAEGPTSIKNWESVATSYPGFDRDLESLRT